MRTEMCQEFAMSAFKLESRACHRVTVCSCGRNSHLLESPVRVRTLTPALCPCEARVRVMVKRAVCNTPPYGMHLHFLCHGFGLHNTACSAYPF